MRTLSASQARRTALHAQGFSDARPSSAVDRRHLRRAMRRLRLLQLDSVPAVIRTQYLPLLSRLGPYRPEQLDELAYTDDEWYEGWAHEASLLPVETEPLLRWSRRRAETGDTWKGLVELARDEPAYIDEVTAEVRERGPIRAGELTNPRPRSGEWWGSRSVGQLALDWLFRIGVVGIRRTASFEKEFDLLERILPEEVRSAPTPTEPDGMRALVAQSAAALGVATADELVDYFRLPKRDAKPRIAELVEEGTLVPVSVQGWDRAAFLSEHARIPRSISACTVLSPFDPVVWHRGRASRLFGFDYRLEIYTPAAKRKYGYYVLPLLVGEQLVGRLDCKTHRDRGVLEVKGAFSEADQDAAAVAPSAVLALTDLAALVGAHSVEVVANGDLSPELARLVGAAIG